MPISAKFHNVDQTSQFSQNFTLSTKFHYFNQSCCNMPQDQEMEPKSKVSPEKYENAFWLGGSKEMPPLFLSLVMFLTAAGRINGLVSHLAWTTPAATRGELYFFFFFFLVVLHSMIFHHFAFLCPFLQAFGTILAGLTARLGMNYVN